jgi:hypothetical protein
MCRGGGGRSVTRLVPAASTSSSLSTSTSTPSTQPEAEQKKEKSGLYESLFGLSSNIAKPNTNR